MAKFNGVVLTEQSMQAARQWYADNAQACIDEARSGRVRVNDLDQYIAWRSEHINNELAGKNDHTWAHLQTAYYIQTGQCVALLP